MSEDNISARVAKLEARIQELEDLRAIQDLVYRYGYSFDDGRMDDFIDCFTEDCVGEYLPFAEGFNGRDEITRFAEGARGKFPRLTETFHFTVSPVIVLDGDVASSRWHWMNPSSAEEASGEFVSAWQFGIYEMEFRREESGWKISRNKVTYLHVFDLTKGYAGQPMFILGSGDAAAADHATA
ncbi:MAG: hypothetical protein JWQ64_2167 [Subtercola sp.]|jgi:hypothetical protein|nr:hypothetical protein [Subtercola sp.]